MHRVKTQYFFFVYGPIQLKDNSCIDKGTDYFTRFFFFLMK